MNMLGRLGIIIMLVGFVTPAVASSGTWYTAEGTVGPGAILVAEYDVYRFEGANAGDVLEAVLEYDASQGNLYLQAQWDEGTGCSVTNVACLAGYGDHVLANPGRTACADYVFTDSFEGSPQALTWTLPEDGAYEIGVIPDFATGPVDYTLRFRVNGEAPDAQAYGGLGMGFLGPLACPAVNGLTS